MPSHQRNLRTTTVPAFKLDCRDLSITMKFLKSSQGLNQYRMASSDFGFKFPLHGTLHQTSYHYLHSQTPPFTSFMHCYKVHVSRGWRYTQKDFAGCRCPSYLTPIYLSIFQVALLFSDYRGIQSRVDYKPAATLIVQAVHCFQTHYLPCAWELGITRWMLFMSYAKNLASTISYILFTTLHAKGLAPLCYLLCNHHTPLCYSLPIRHSDKCISRLELASCHRPWLYDFLPRVWFKFVDRLPLNPDWIRLIGEPPSTPMRAFEVLSLTWIWYCTVEIMLQAALGWRYLPA
jgi:hypothetical protein